MSVIEAWFHDDVDKVEELNEGGEEGAEVRFKLAEIKRIFERERRHQEFVKTPHFSNGDKFKTVIGEEFNFRSYLVRLERLAGRLLTREEEPVFRSLDRRGEVKVKLTSLGNTVLALVRELDPSVLSFYRNHEFKPDLAVLLGEITSTRSKLVSVGHVMSGFTPEIAEILDQFVSQARVVLRSNRIRNMMKNHRRKERQNFKSCWRYVRWLFGRRSRLLFVRIDLYFRPFAKEWGCSLEANRCHSRFLRALRENRLGLGVIGYLSKREIGIDRGTHYHVIIAIDGHLHRNAAYMARVIGEHWERICGVGEVCGIPRASYFNCYTLKDFYEYNCIGLVSLKDWKMLKGLEIAIRYMCKETSHVRAGVFELSASDGLTAKRLNIGKRNIIRGVMKISNTPKRGRPQAQDVAFDWKI